MRARASPTDAVTTSHRRGDIKLDLQSANSSVCGGDDPEDLTVNSSSGMHQHSGGASNNNLHLRYGPGDLQLLHNNKGTFPTAMDLIDNYARSGGGGTLSPFLPSFTKDHNLLQQQQSGDKHNNSPYNNKAFLDSYLKALVETNPPLFYASKIAGDMIKHDMIAADDAEYSSASDEEDDDEDSVNDSSPLPLQAGKN